MKEKGWFGFRRSVDEQLLGLEKALAFAEKNTVLDLGCAEGEISKRFAERAFKVHALERDGDFLKVAETQPGVLARLCDLNGDWPKWLDAQYDVVLCLAVLHKLQDPKAGLRKAIGKTRSLMVVRLPVGSNGLIVGKHHTSHNPVDLNDEMPRHGFSLETFDGPRGEVVQYWSR